jgi:GT2 family glycosyltransferase
MQWPKISIVVTAYLPASKRYLDACIESIKRLDYPQELIDTVIVTPTWYAPHYDRCKTIHPCVGQYHNPVAINFGARETNQDSKHILFLNDDVILTRLCLKKMVMMIGESDVIMGPISNCDNFWFFDAELPLGLNSRQFRMEEIESKLDAMMDADLPTGPVRTIRPQTLYLYANLIPRKVWNRVQNGTSPDAIGFDETFRTGFDDTDYCIRAQKAGCTLVIATDVLIWHCSGTSADSTIKSEERIANEKYFRAKWAAR